MKPTLVKKCKYGPSLENDYEVQIDYDLQGDMVSFPEYCLIYEDDDYWIGLKPLFGSDGFSIPRLVWTLTGLTPFGLRTAFAGFVHDGIYRSHLLPRSIADDILLNILCIAPSPNLVQRQIAYRTLQVVGWMAYNSKTQAEIDRAKQFVTVIEKKKLQMGFMLR
jgi:hypothetical protein